MHSLGFHVFKRDVFNLTLDGKEKGLCLDGMQVNARDCGLLHNFQAALTAAARFGWLSKAIHAPFSSKERPVNEQLALSPPQDEVSKH